MPGMAPTPDKALSVLDANAVRRWAVLIRAAYAARRAEIDALNVFPVPDGDTGTNLYLTFDGAVERTLAQEVRATEVGQLLGTFARNLLWSARGNSGVILSQLASGLAQAAAGRESLEAADLAQGLALADELAWKAVSAPKEGTILSVSKAMAAAAGPAVDDGLYAVALAACDAAIEALARTPEQLPVLARAGVVDAGGAGLVILLECLERLCAGEDGRVVLRLGSSERARPRPDPGSGPMSVARPLDEESPSSSPATHDDLDDLDEGPAPEYEVMYLLADADDEAVEVLRAHLVELGDSVLVVGGDGQWNVHAHVDDPGAAVEAGIEAGRPHRIRVTRLVDDLHGDPGRTRQGRAVTVPAAKSGVVACAAGPGLADVFREVGAVVVMSGPGSRTSTGALIDAIREQHATGVGGVLLLPNDHDTELAGAAAARVTSDEGIETHMVRARAAVQGIAAVAVFDPAAKASVNALAMQAAASATRHGAVTIANRAALTSGGPCQPGDVLGIVDGDIVIVGSDQQQVTREVVRRLLSSGGELLTVVSGHDAAEGLDEAASAEAREHRGVEVTHIVGGQQVYGVLLGVE